MIRYLKYFIFLFLVLNISCKGKDVSQFSFIQLNDPQLGMSEYEKDMQRFKQAVKQINELDVDFVVICGDFVQHASDSSFSDFLSIKGGFEMPSYLVPGNHDIGKVPNDTTLSYYRKTFGNDYYDFQHKGYSFIVTNSLLWKADIAVESDKHNLWFEDALAKANESPLIVVGHFPIFTKEPDEEEHYFNLPLDKRMKLLNSFQRVNVKAYLSGHKHELIINEYKGIQLVTGETTSKNFDDRPFGFRLWKVDGDSISHTFIELQGE